MARLANPETPETVREQLVQTLTEGDTEVAAERLKALHPAAIADVLEASPPEERLALWRLIPAEVRGEVLVESPQEVRLQLIDATAPEDLVRAAERLDVDDLADIDHELPAAAVEAILQAMDEQRRRGFEAVRSYPDDSAGGLMDADALAIRSDVRLNVVLRYLRRLRQHQGRLPDHLDALMVVDRNNRYTGVLRLTDLVSLETERRVGEVMDSTVAGVPATMPAARVARLFQDRDLVSAAVIDERGRLIGRITVDDVVDVIGERAEEAALAPAGLESGVDLFAPVLTSAKRRIVWLGVHLIGAFVAAWVIGLFGASIEQLVALAILMPVVAAMGGVAGSQTQTLVTRGIALERVGRANAPRLLRNELGVSLANGAFWAVVVAIVASLWFGNLVLAVVFGAALAINLLAAAFAGTLVPLALNRFGFDPALGSAVVVMALTDTIGYLVFLSLATLFVV